MANPGSILGQIGESFEQIGQDVAKQTVQAPKDIAQAAAESLGLTGGKKSGKQQQGKAGNQQNPEGTSAPSNEPSPEIKRAIARAALEELSGKRKPKEKSVWDQMKEEEEQKKLLEKRKKEEARKQALPKSAAKRPRGDLYGKKAKQTQIENRNVRQD